MLCLNTILNSYQNRKTLDLIVRAGTSAEDRYISNIVLLSNGICSIISNKVTCLFNKPKDAAYSFSLIREHLMGVDGVRAPFDQRKIYPRNSKLSGLMTKALHVIIRL